MTDQAMLKHARAKHVEWVAYEERAQTALTQAQRMKEFWAGQVRQLEGETND